MVAEKKVFIACTTIGVVVGAGLSFIKKQSLLGKRQRDDVE